MNDNKRKERSHGAVSIFLAIILVPCMVFTCVFGDLSRVQLSMAASQSAADLALYSLLARYDEDLKEYYGLVASCQDIEKYYEVTENYFMGMLKAEGVSGEGSQLFLNYLSDLKNGNYSDLLRTDIVEAVNVDEVEGANMRRNAALIEDGIVEFMKYRGPIQLTTKLIDRFSDLDFGNTITEADKNKTVTDAKQEYAEVQGELLKMAFYTYRAIREYEKLRDECGLPDGGKYKQLSEELPKIRDDLLGATTIITEYYFPGTENLKKIDFPNLNTSDHTTDKESVGKEVEVDGNKIYCIDNELLQDLLEGLDDDLEDITEAADGFLTACNDIPAPGSGINEVVYCMKMQSAIDGCGVVTTIKNKGNEVLETYGKLQAAAECEPMPENSDLPADWKEQIQAACEKIEKVYNNYLKQSGSSSYQAKVKEYSDTASKVVPKVERRQYTFSSKFTGNGGETLDGFVQAVTSYLNPIKGDLQDQIENLDRAIDGGFLPDGKLVVSLDTLLDKAEEFVTVRKDWGNAAANAGTEYGDSEYELYQSAEAASSGSSVGEDPEVEGEKIAAQITGESVAELKSRLENIRSDMKKCLEALDNVSYGGVKLTELGDGEKLIKAAHTVVPQTTDISLEAARNAARGYFSSLMKPSEGTLYQTPVQDSSASGNDPDLNKATPALYKYFKEKFTDREMDVDKNIEEKEQELDGYQEDANGKKDAAVSTKDTYITGKGKNLTDMSGGATVNLLSSLDSVVTVADNVLSGSGDELRDQLYVCEYIMDMFSYATLNNEGKYRLEKDSNENVTFNDFPYSNQQELWDADDPRSVMENQSLTNRPLTAANNHAFLGEVEYILYGKDSVDGNLGEAYKNIFAIREMLNVVSGFANFYNNSVISGIAQSTFALTAGIVPVPLTKCVLILVLATLESAKDMERLKAGGRVDLYKMKAEDWFYNLEPGSAFPPGSGSSKGPESGLYYSDYMYVFLLIGLTSGETYSAMLLRVGDLIQANMRLAIGDEENKYSLEKARCYFSLTGELRVRPLMLTLPIVTTVEGSDQMLETTDWCTYKVDLIRGYS